ncbi:MAG: ABC transporter substrate-binding protein [Acidobacteriia bacterium]|nr:ABC transporter substrate-binding protein [Terriglobia bacterium]
MTFKMPARRPVLAVLAAAVAAFALVAPAAPGVAQNLAPVSLRMDWLPISYHAPFYLARAKGYYKANGIDLKIENGKGSGATIQLVANGVDTFGLADAAVVAKSVSQDIPEAGGELNKGIEP